MAAQNYQRTITVDASLVDVYRTLTKEYDRWWTITGNKVFNKVGDQIKFIFPSLVSYWTFEAKNLEPNHLVELECIDAYHEMSSLPDAPNKNGSVHACVGAFNMTATIPMSISLTMV